MSALASGSGNPTHKWGKIPGQKVSGEIVEIRDRQALDFNSREPKTYKDGNPIMESVLTLEQPDGSLLDVFISGKNMKNAVVKAYREHGLTDVAKHDHIEILFTDYDGNARTFESEYSVFDPTA